MTFHKSVSSVIQRQYANSNIGALMIAKAALWDKFIGDISAHLLDEVLNFDKCDLDALIFYWGKLFKVSKTFTLNNGEIIQLSDAEFRIVLKIRAFSLLWDGTAIRANEFLSNVFDIPAYTLDPQDMTYLLYFFGEIPPNLKRVLETSDVFPHPAGVQLKVRSVIGKKRFAFVNYAQVYVLPGLIGFQTYTNLKDGIMLTYKS